VNQRISRRAALTAGALGTAALALNAAPVPKGEDKTLVGKIVLPKSPDPVAVFEVPPLGRDARQVLEAASWEVKGTKDGQRSCSKTASRTCSKRTGWLCWPMRSRSSRRPSTTTRTKRTT
jgi:hypothetical protein